MSSATPALRYALGDHHTYEFTEGVVSAAIHPAIREHFPPSDSYFHYFDEDDAAGCLKALHDLDGFVAAEGPFDGVIAFSQGASIATTLMLHRLQQDRARELMGPVFKCAIFFGAVIPCDPGTLVGQCHIQAMSYEANGEAIGVPTTHIWGKRRIPSRWRSCAAESKGMCMCTTADMRFLGLGWMRP